MNGEINSQESYAWVWPLLLGGALTVLGGVLGNWIALAQQQRQKRRGLRAALLAEVSALLDLAEKRKYLKGLQEALNRPNDDEVVNFTFSVRGNYQRVFESNAEHIGALPPDEATAVVDFYTLVSAFLEDVADLRESPPASHDEADLRLSEAEDFLKRTLEAGSTAKRLLSR